MTILPPATSGFQKPIFGYPMVFFREGMCRSINKYLRSCHECQTKNNLTVKPAGTLSFFSSPGRPFQRVGIDFLGLSHSLRQTTAGSLLPLITIRGTRKPRKLLKLQLSLSPIFLCTRFFYGTGLPTFFSVIVVHRFYCT